MSIPTITAAIANATNGTASIAASNAKPSSVDFHTLVSTLLSASALRDWLKLFVVGGALETCRRYLFSWWDAIVQAFWITATFDATDDAYRWVLYWLSRHPVWNEARTFEVSTRTFGLDYTSDEDEGETTSRPVSYLPSLENTYSIWYKHFYTTVAREEKAENRWSKKESLELRILARDRSILQSLLDEAREAYKAAEKKHISIYAADISGDWRFMTCRPKRPLSSDILDPGIKELLLNDARDFLDSRKWYTDRGIPFRRGYLLYGAPGSGKTSMIQSIAGELRLNVYIVTLSRIGMDDSSLNELISNMPQRCIALLEDIDAAFTTGIKRDLPLDVTVKRSARGKEDDDSDDESNKKARHDDKNVDTGSRVTLSGLLNALDGIGAQEGRILFATTNNYKALDPALCRPGRMDLHVEFKLASRHQAESLYKCFYMPDGTDDTDGSRTDEGYRSRRGGVDNDETDDEDDSVKNSEKKPLLRTSSSRTRRSSASPPPSPSTLPNSHLSHHHLSRSEVLALAARFADTIPEREFSMASLQGYLMIYKTRAREAVENASEWVEKERTARKERS
ncbi:P-loop containing nucleoside triphosphate hydrolase protein [Daedalea quercina L-15889]|uniref:p-loop containing nucleoside triphosphate hydrolase protein n=1 Tax=Daedalea quercina L-15889 TaxID=1314783 RepID=A0A165N5B1_9APHY|nr:P-loop containing nucleoside triphosphate hydrolase protein [Daedalea quercina L-15889]